MATTFVKIQTVTVGAGGSSTISFTSIPQTYTDLKIVISGRTDFAAVASNNSISFNGSATSFSSKLLAGDGGSAASYSRTDNLNVFLIPGSSATASIFGNSEIYIPNYTSANNKSFYCDSTTENNGTASYTQFQAGSWSNTSAITSITLTSQNGNFVQYSTATLYGISNVTASGSSYGSGGDRIYTDGTYWYHQFLTTGTSAFIPTRNLTVDYLVVGGGGAGGGGHAGGGGGAGGFQTGSLSLVANTSYTATVGAGGVGATESIGTVGGNSVFSSVTSNGGGYGASENGVASTGGSGGAGSGGLNAVKASANGTSGQGNAGGTGSNFSGGYGSGAGGGGAGATGSNASTTGGAGGNGTASSITGTSTTYAGGGGGGGWQYNGGAGGSGGGGAGGNVNGPGSAATANTGGGGGGSAGAGSPRTGGNGGSGIIVIRYAV